MKMYSTMPIALNERILSSGLSKAQLKKAYKLIHSFRRICHNKDKGLQEFVPLPAILISKIIGSDYKIVLEKLKKNQVIQVQSWLQGARIVESYDKGRCRKYRINPELSKGDIIPVYYNERSVKHPLYVKINNRRCATSIVTNDLKSLIINSKKLLSITDHVVNTISCVVFKTDGEIKANNFCVLNNYTGFKKWTSYSKCMEYIKARKSTLVQDGRRYFIDDLDRYVEFKRRNTLWSYKTCINRLVMQSYNVSRNTKNNRLDHNLTATSKNLMAAIIEDNDLVEIDLKNSQFAILAYLMQKDRTVTQSSDFETFCKITADGNLYEYLADEFRLITRNEAKEMMMILAFSSHRYHCPEKAKLKGLFPVVFTFIEDYKKRNVKKFGREGYKSFAVWLQKTEAWLFIDNLYFNLKVKRKMFVITKHDSLLVRKSDEGTVRFFIEEYFKSINFKCTLK